MKRLILAGAVLALSISAAAIAQPVAMMHQGMQGGGGHDSHGAASTLEGDQSASSLAFRGANEKMHRDMAVPLTGDADADFVRSMIPHHQGAIDMAKIVVAFGKDPEIRQLAETIIAAQEKEIADMRAWLERNGK